MEAVAVAVLHCLQAVSCVTRRNAKVAKLGTIPMGMAAAAATRLDVKSATTPIRHSV